MLDSTVVGFTYLNVLSNDFWIVTYGLHKENLHTLGSNPVKYENQAAKIRFSETEGRQKPDLVSVLLGKVEDQISAVGGGVGGIQNL